MKPSMFIAGLLAGHTHLALLIAPLFGEEVVVFLAVLSGRGIVPFYEVFFFGILGVLIIDSVMFFSGRYLYEGFLSKYKFISKRMNKIKLKPGAVKSKKLPVYIFITKFIWGTRIPSILYLGTQKIKYLRFIVYDFLAIMLWALIILPVSWLAGRGFTRLLGIVRGAERLLVVALIVALIFFVASKIFSKYIGPKVMKDLINSV